MQEGRREYKIIEAAQEGINMAEREGGEGGGLSRHSPRMHLLTASVVLLSLKEGDIISRRRSQQKSFARQIKRMGEMDVMG